MLTEPNRHDRIMARYPRLIRILKWLAVLSNGEATGCILSYIRGDDYSSEAVYHYGGPTKLIQQAIQFRERTRFLLECAGCGHTLHEFRGLECRWEDDCTACEDAYLRAITESIQDGRR
jgi:hypothetical protein